MTTQVTEPLPEPPPKASRRLTRSSSDRVIGGVAGGLGRYFSVDPVVIRVAFIVGVFFGGAGAIAYLAAWVIVPGDDGAAGSGFDTAGVMRRLGIGLGALVLTAIAVVGGFFGVATGGGTATAIVVIAVGGVLVLGTFTRGMRWLIVPALALALSAGAAAAGDIDVRGGTGERIYRPADDAGLRDSYQLGMGHLRVDLRDAKLTGDHTINLRPGIGQAEVLVPRNVCVSSTAHIAGGATTVFDHESGGSYHDWQEIRRPAGHNPHLTVNARIGFGQLRIEPDVEGNAVQEACANG